jgi:hypothetical protein
MAIKQYPYDKLGICLFVGTVCGAIMWVVINFRFSDINAIFKASGRNFEEMVNSGNSSAAEEDGVFQ